MRFSRESIVAGGSGKTVLIGLDGATFDLIDPLVAEGVMPRLGRVMREGARAVLRSTIHPLTPPAWATLMTGRSPGNHGVFDFIRVDTSGATPRYTLVTSADLAAPTIWEIASRAGKHVTTLNFPVMFPVKPITGVAIPGYVPWSYLGRAVYPRQIMKDLKAHGLFKASEISTDWQHERQAIQGLAEEQLEDWVRFHIDRELRWQSILLHLMANHPADLTAMLFDGVDRVQHLCYHLVDPATREKYNDSPAARTATELALTYYRNLDGFIGQIIEKAGPEGRILIVSDHGFTPSGGRIFYANTWLEQQGWLGWVDGTPIDDQGRLALDENTEASTLIDWSRTKAYSLSSSSNAIFIRQATEPGGPGVAPDEYDGFRAELVSRLKAIIDPKTGRPLVREVLLREEAFPGAYTGRAPDITLQLHDYSFLSVLRADGEIKDRKAPYATHHPDGVVIAHGAGIAGGARCEPIEIADIAATTLYSMGLAVPDDMEGDVARSLFSPEHLEAHPVRRGAASEASQSGADETPMPEEAEEQIRERLKSLGYL